MPNQINNNSNVHYVKFMRGSQTSWKNLLNTPEKINNDTLYFIYENAQNSKNGKLYLGQKLISGVGDGSLGDININDIGDINIDGETLADKQLLVYNETSEKWENISLSTIIDTAVGVMQGATPAAAGEAGLVPAPQIEDKDKFLKGDGTWNLVEVPTFNSNVFLVSNNKEVNLNGFNFAPVGSVPVKTNNGLEWISAPVGTLNRKITTLEKLQAQLSGEDPDPLDNDVIYMVLNGNSDASENKYDEYMIIENKLERLGTFGEVNLNNYVTIDMLDDVTDNLIPTLAARVTTIENTYVTQAQIGDLNTLLLSEGNSTLVEEVNTLSDRLKWHDLNNL